MVLHSSKSKFFIINN
jgi:hypothetical protein